MSEARIYASDRVGCDGCWRFWEPGCPTQGLCYNAMILREETLVRNTALLEKIEVAIAEKSLLKHPFYQDWQAGKLSREALQLYAAQYYRHVEAFPKHLRALAARADASLKPVVLENLAEEENPSAPHPQLWRDFAAALGVSEDDIAS